MKKTHKFVVTVNTTGLGCKAETALAAILYAFATRRPDGFSFDTQPLKPKKTTDEKTTEDDEKE